MATEEQLLNTIFDDGSSANEKAAAVEKLKKATGKDRAGLVEKYTKAASSSSPWGSDYAARRIGELTTENVKLRLEIAGLELKIENLKVQHEQELARRVQIDDLLIQGHQAEVRRLKAERDAFEFDLAIRKSPVFPEIKCAAPGCVNMFRPSRRDATTCSAACRKALSRAQKKAAIEAQEV
jgi:hypothetical protein